MIEIYGNFRHGSRIEEVVMARRQENNVVFLKGTPPATAAEQLLYRQAFQQGQPVEAEELCGTLVFDNGDKCGMANGRMYLARGDDVITPGFDRILPRKENPEHYEGYMGNLEFLIKPFRV